MDPLSLPNQDDCEAWEATNKFFSTYLVPYAMSLEDPEDINRELIKAIYSHFSELYSTQSPSNPKAVRKRKKHDRRVKRLREVKNTSRREYRKALRTHQPVAGSKVSVGTSEQP